MNAKRTSFWDRVAHFKVVEYHGLKLSYCLTEHFFLFFFFLNLLMHPVSPEWDCLRRKWLLAFVLKLNICRIIMAITLLNIATHSKTALNLKFSFSKVNSSWVAESDYINWYLGQTEQKSQIPFNTVTFSVLIEKVLKLRAWIHVRMNARLTS